MESESTMDALLQQPLIEWDRHDGRSAVLGDQGKSPLLRLPEEISGTLAKVADREDV
jgi:hypothetical protein